MQPWFLCRSPFTMAANICGLHHFCRWMIKKPELCHRLIRLALNHIIEVIDDWIGTFGANRLFIQMSSPSESNQLISSQYFRRFALPYYAQLFDQLRDMQIEHFMFHICGDQNANLPHLASLSSWPHPAILSFGHEVELEVAARLFPEDIIYGNIEPALIQESSPKQVYENCRQAIQKGKNIQSGFILGIGCVLPVESPPLNVFAITKAANDFGWYE